MKPVIRKAWNILRIVVATTAFVLGMLVIVFELYAFALLHFEADTPLPSNLGNFERVRAQLTDNGRKEFAFAVVGDTKGHSTFDAIREEIPDNELAFMVLLGDCVGQSTPGYHHFFRMEWGEEFATSYPVFFIPGNHDVDEETFPLRRFEETYGPTIFSFEFKGCLFVFLRMIEGYSTKESVDYLESVLSARRSAVDKVFVLMHTPPPVSEDFQVRRTENSEALVRLLDRYRVDYVLGADQHGFARTRVFNTAYLVTGGGGGRLRKTRYGRFFHAVVLKVGPHSVSERILQVEERNDLDDRLERYAVAHFQPWFAANPFSAAAVNVLATAGCLPLVLLVWRRRRRKHAG